MSIKDSGERTTFDTGAVRDMHEGKGRMDLLPWAVQMEIRHPELQDIPARLTLPEPPVSISQEDAVRAFFEHDLDEGECYD